MRAPILPVHPDDIPKDDPELDDLRHSLTLAEARIAELEAHSENLDKSLTRTEEKLKAAIETLERVNGRAQPQLGDEYAGAVRALRDIRAMCTEALIPRADGGRG